MYSSVSMRRNGSAVNDSADSTRSGDSVTTFTPLFAMAWIVGRAAQAACLDRRSTDSTISTDPGFTFQAPPELVTPDAGAAEAAGAVGAAFLP